MKFPGQHAVRRPTVVSRAAFAQAVGATRGAITKAAKPGKRLHAAVRGDGIDTSHPTAQAWLAEARGRPAEVQPYEERASDDIDENEITRVDLGEFATLTLVELDERHGNVRELRGYIRARRDIEEARKATLLRLRTQGRLIPVRTVELMLAHLDAAFRLLLSETPRTIASRLAPTDPAAAIAIVRDLISQHLTRAKDAMLASLEANDSLAPIPVPADPVPFDEGAPVPSGYQDA